jgi:hypothetical protein
MSGVRLVHLRTVDNTFHARVIAARLGADGIVTELRGSVDGPYPIGNVSVWVREEDADSARELLMVDEVESALELDPDGDSPATRPFLLGLTRRQLIALIALIAFITTAFVSRLVI